MKAVMVLGVLAAMSAPVFADCTSPNDAITIPDGSTASRDDMIAAQKAVRAFDSAVKDYSTCLQAEEDAKVAAGGDKAKLLKQYADLQNAQVDKAQKLADQFNMALRAFKAKNTGG